MANLIDQSTLELVYGVDLVVQVFQDSGANTVNATILALYLAAGSKRVKEILYPSFPDESQIEELIAGDEAVQIACAQIVMGLASVTRRTHLVNPDGKTHGAIWLDQGEKYLGKIAAGERRMPTEATSGGNRTLTARTVPKNVPRVFIPDAKRPRGQGMY